MTVTHLLILLAIGYTLFALDKKRKSIPVPLLLVLIGMGLSLIPYFSSVEITRKMLYELLLPPLLFISAYRFSYSSFRKHGLMMTLLSTVGLLLTALLLGSLIWLVGPLMLSMSFIAALVIATVLTPTDPVSVVSVLKESDVKPMLVSVIEGESMINDGTSIVAFTIASNILLSKHPFSMVNFLQEFLTVSLGGAAIGLVVGWLLAKSIYFTHHKEYQVMLSIVVCYGSFHIAEHIHVSGVLAAVMSGLMMSYEFQKSQKEEHFRDSLEGFWGVVEPSISSIIFLIIGIVSVKHITWEHWPLMIVIFLISLVVRYVMLLALAGPVKPWRQELGWRGFIILTAADVRGTMSVVLLLTLVSKQMPENLNFILSISFGVVLLSLILQSVIIYPLAKLVEK
ncbi:cation:proton antiporter [Paenibacillus tarimensis]|uniref:cation:proton antiporter n=1 Tax=Paenibacillus tarimensis TaxID=416012 RepID=UPI001F1585C3|nr:cation:proton antiporter [Paenibacillus tarimensis]MCF2945120.1 cation:proton antiporter [Paenibacillus tarimensis]